MVALLLTFALVSVANAQTRNKKKTTQKSKSKPVVVEKTPQERLFEEMLPATAQILIIDSVVADKQTFLKTIPLTGDAGYYTSYNNFFGSKNENDKYLYIIVNAHYLFLSQFDSSYCTAFVFRESPGARK